MGKIAEEIKEVRKEKLKEAIEYFEHRLEVNVLCGYSNWEVCLYDIETSEDFLSLLDMLRVKYQYELKINLKWVDFMLGFHTLKVRVVGL